MTQVTLDIQAICKQKPQSVYASKKTCADCPFYKAHNDGTKNGWCQLFNHFAREYHQQTQDCINEIAVTEEVEEVNEQAIAQEELDEADDPWWVAADVCAVLEHSNPSSAIARLDDDEKKLLDPKQYLGSSSNQEFWAINESGLYSLILTSRKPQAKRFKKWVTSEVLPAIRKTGSYAPTPPLPTPPTPQEISELYDLTLGGAGLDPKLVAGVKLNAIASYHPALKSAAEIAKPALQIEVESQLLSPTQLGQILSDRTQHTWTPRQVNKLLTEQGFQYRNPDSNSPAYLPTEKGRQYCKVILNTAVGRDKTIQSLRWFKEIVEVLEVNNDRA
ncbi:hypothetical protein NIES592_08145 [Fischerella major NIES-592]|uniref:Bro-N domain-containing protein n=1 Tax=Fischerella major NIES-592 TaxID=210994 RepID=A0A1U7H1M2_9CYAN|nr:Bro-N domain-containing protein [Fischerella major]OKH14838.1 hypothetical protein NIES592_08145 [Fischerella major NIES-592]